MTQQKTKQLTTNHVRKASKSHPLVHESCQRILLSRIWIVVHLKFSETQLPVAIVVLCILL